MTDKRKMDLTLAGLVIDGAGARFAGDDFRALMRPCVYVFCRSGLPLYVGMSRLGVGRPFSANHQQASEAQAECDEVLVYPCISVEAAQFVETTLIRMLRPRYNRRIKAQAQREEVAAALGVTAAAVDSLGDGA